MRVKDKMTPHPIFVSPDLSVGDAWQILQEKSLNRMPVVDRGRLLGIITRTDFGTRRDLNLRAVSPAATGVTPEDRRLLTKTKVRDLMPEEQELITIHQDAYIEMAAKILRENKIGGLPVVDDDYRLVGIITQTDMFDAFLEMLAINRRGTRITVKSSTDPDVIIKLGTILKDHQMRLENIVGMENKSGNTLIIRVNSDHAQGLVNDLKNAGFEVESVIVKQ